MKKYVSLIFAALLTAALFIPGLCMANEIAIESFVDKKTLMMGDKLTLTVKISGQVIGSLPAPSSLPGHDGFDIGGAPFQSSSFSFVNGRVSASKTMNYILLPRSEGKFLVGEVKLTYKGNEYRSRPIEVTVTAAPKAPQGEEKDEQLSRLSADPLGRVLISSSLNKKQAYLGEGILYTFSFFHKVRLWENPQYDPPVFSDFWSEDLPPQKGTKEVIIKGRRYLRQDIKKVLFPTREGLLTVGSTTFSALLDPFARPITLRTEPIEVEVLPLPGEPEGFSGIAGNFTIEAGVENLKAKEDEPVIVKVKIAGVGNIKAITPPSYEESEFFRGYEPKDSMDISTFNDMISGTKSFEFLFVPLKSGDLKLPVFSFTFFDPAKEKFRTLKTKDITVSVKASAAAGLLKSSEPGALLGNGAARKSLRPIRMKSDLANWNPYSYFQGVYLILILLPPLTLTGIIAARGASRRQEKTSGAVKRAMKALKLAESMSSADDSRDFFSSTSSALIDYFAHKLNMAPASVSKEELGIVLGEARCPEALIERIEKVMTTADMGRFSPTRYSKEEMENFLDEAVNIIRDFDKSGLERKL
ncbi:MAG: BatD family protein [Deltaproteobacteria bacterium]|nr:BatD family protein [Deltaproteobacteria bacterium]